MVRLHSGDVWPEAERNLWLELPGGLIYKDNDEAANRGGLPTLRALFFFKATLKSAVAIPAAPKLHRESQPPLCEPGLMGLTSRQVRFVSGP